MEGYNNGIRQKIRYDSFEIYVPDDLTQEFITGFGEFGLHVGKVHCFSAKPTSIKEFLNFVYERGKSYAPSVLKALDMLQKNTASKLKSQQIESLLI